MSTDFYIACHKCRKIIDVASVGASGFSFYYGEPECMKKLTSMLDECLVFHREQLAFVQEQGPEWDDYERVEWHYKGSTP